MVGAEQEAVQFGMTRRRSTLLEGWVAGCIAFTATSIVMVSWAATFHQKPDFADAFLCSCGAGIGYAAASLAFRTKLVVL